MPRTYRKTVIPNVYEDNHGYEIILHRKGIPSRARFDRDTSVAKLKAARDRMIEDLIVKAAKKAPGTLAGDTETYLATLPTGRSRDDRAHELAPWVNTLGPLKRDRITPQMVRQQLAIWQTEGRKPSTLNHRRQALRSLYKTLDGPDAVTPCDHVKKLPERYDIRDIPPACVLAILRRIPNTPMGARIKVIARTGIPHAQIKRLQPSDLHLNARAIDISPRRKGSGVPAKRLPLTYAAVRAFRLFDRLDAYGDFSNSNLHKLFTRAVKLAIKHWPKDKGAWPARKKIRPYDLRHAFLTEVYRRTKDLRATAELGLHASMTMTARYAEAAVSATAAAARDAMEPRRMALRGNRRK